MSFAISAIGRRDDVVKQLRHCHAGNQALDKVGRETALLVARNIEHDGNPLYIPADVELVYNVEISGHSLSGGVTNLTVKVEPRFNAVVPTEDEIADADL